MSYRDSKGRFWLAILAYMNSAGGRAKINKSRGFFSVVKLNCQTHGQRLLYNPKTSIYTREFSKLKFLRGLVDRNMQILIWKVTNRLPRVGR